MLKAQRARIPANHVLLASHAQLADRGCRASARCSSVCGLEVAHRNRQRWVSLSLQNTEAARELHQRRIGAGAHCVRALERQWGVGARLFQIRRHDQRELRLRRQSKKVDAFAVIAIGFGRIQFARIIAQPESRRIFRINGTFEAHVNVAQRIAARVLVFAAARQLQPVARTHLEAQRVNRLPGARGRRIPANNHVRTAREILRATEGDPVLGVGDARCLQHLRSTRAAEGAYAVHRTHAFHFAEHMGDERFRIHGAFGASQKHLLLVDINRLVSRPGFGEGGEVSGRSCDCKQRQCGNE